MPNVAAHPSVGIHREQSSLGALFFGAIGIVFGDIGTSPLYTMKETFVGPTLWLWTSYMCWACCR